MTAVRKNVLSKAGHENHLNLLTADILPDVTEWIPSGFESLDRILGGGWASGRASEIFGPEGCLSGDTFVQYEVRSLEGKRKNYKGGTIADLYARFHKIPRKGRGKYPRKGSESVMYSAPSINDEGCIFQNRVVDVVKTGVKTCFEVRTLSGCSLIATADHKMFTGPAYVSVGDLVEGDIVYVHNNTANARGIRRGQRIFRKYVFVKAHPVAGVKWAIGYRYHRLLRSRAVVEADMNGLTYDEYVERLNNYDLDGLKFLTRDQEVHHLDEDVRNDALENLYVVEHREHARLHAFKNHNNLRYVAVPDAIESITPVGERETYDMKMAYPCNNYVANGLVVHNSGKSALTHMAIKQCTDQGGQALYLDFEMALDIAKVEQLEIPRDQVIHHSPECIEEAWDVVWAAMEELEAHPPDAPFLIVWDSIAASVPRAELLEVDSGKAHIGLVARAMSKGCRKMYRRIAQVRAHMMWVNQERDNIGGGPFSEKVTPGGSAARYAASQRVRVGRVSTLKSGKGLATGYLVRATTRKSRLFPPHRKMNWVLDFDYGPSPTLTILSELIDARIIRSVGGGFYKAKWWGEKFKKADWMSLWADVPDFRAGAQATFSEAVTSGLLDTKKK